MDWYHVARNVFIECDMHEIAYEIVILLLLIIHSDLHLNFITFSKIASLLSISKSRISPPPYRVLGMPLPTSCP